MDTFTQFSTTLFHGKYLLSESTRVKHTLLNRNYF